jgi:hypothetical protein
MSHAATSRQLLGSREGGQGDVLFYLSIAENWEKIS